MKKSYMNKLVLILFVGLMLFTLRSLASSRTYQIVNANSALPVIKHGPNGGPIEAKMPALNPVVIDINEDNGELYVVFNSSMPSTRIIIRNGEVVNEEDYVDVAIGQIIIYNIGSYEEGRYTLTVESEGKIMSQYEITINDE